MPGVKKSNDVELQLHESDATDQTEVSVNRVIMPVTYSPITWYVTPAFWGTNLGAM